MSAVYLPSGLMLLLFLVVLQFGCDTIGHQNGIKLGKTVNCIACESR